MYALSLEEISNRNLVGFFREELQRGAFSELSKGAFRTLKKYGVIHRGCKPGVVGIKIILTEYGRELLEEVKKMNEKKETREYTDRPEGNLGAVKRVGGEQG